MIRPDSFVAVQLRQHILDVLLRSRLSALGAAIRIHENLGQGWVVLQRGDSLLLTAWLVLLRGVPIAIAAGIGRCGSLLTEWWHGSAWIGPVHCCQKFLDSRTVKIPDEVLHVWWLSRTLRSRAYGMLLWLLSVWLLLIAKVLWRHVGVPGLCL